MRSIPRRTLPAALSCLILAAPAAAQTLLLREPTVSARHIAFAYANNIWITSREGGDARRLTSFQGETSNPRISPDGNWVAFSGQYGGNSDVYLVPAEGGEPKRLTWHPADDEVVGWTPDGKSVVFTSSRTSAPTPGVTNFWTVSVEGGLPRALPIPRGSEGHYSADGQRFAYRMTNYWDPEWRNYRGGQNRPVWVMDLASYEIETPPWTDSKDTEPVWVGDKVFFLSDRDWLVNVWSYDTKTKQLAQVTHFTDYDIKSLESGGGTIVFEQAGRIHLLDPATGQHHPVPITVRGDFPWMTPEWKDVSRSIREAALSPTGKRAAFEARGEIFTVPAEKGDWRNLTRTAGVAERSPAWSPDGKWVSWFSDASGEYRLIIASQDGSSPREVTLPTPTFYFTPQWSPDSKKILFTDTGLRLWWVDVATGKATHADTDQYMVPERSMNPVWSPDSRWIAYTKRDASQIHSVFVYDTQTGQTRQVTDGMADATWPAWDRSGKYLYFLASTNFALRTGWLDMSSYDRPVTRAVYLAVLKAGDPSPLLPQSDEEGGATGGRPDGPGGRAGPNGPKQADSVTVTIDFDGLESRLVPVDLPLRDYSRLQAGATGTIFFLENVPATGVNAGPPPGDVLFRYQLSERKAVQFAANVQTYLVSADGKKVLYRTPGQGGAYHLVDADKAPPQANAGRLSLGLRMLVDPAAEYAQMFSEGWRFQRDFLYVPNLHGADYAKTKALYAPFVPFVRHRTDFNYLLDVLGSEVAIGHSFVRGGDVPDIPRADPGLLGADFEVANGRYRITRIYTGGPWNPTLKAPLGAPGVGVSVGDYILAVNGADLAGTDNIYRLLEGTANRQTELLVNGTPSTDGARTVTVVPVPSEVPLRTMDWVEANRRKVDSLSGGKLGYVYLPNTAQGGYTFFNRYFFPQQDRQGMVVDERFNGGGSAADYIVNVLDRKLQGYFNNPVGKRTPFNLPEAGNWGPKVMIVNEMAGSGGDLMPYLFKQMKVGPLVGKRTWGGLVGTWDTPPLIDGGVMIAPRGGFFDLEGKWAVENQGVAPDIDVEMTPKEVIAGRDPQLERAVAEAMRLLKEHPVVLKPEPAPPVRSRRPGAPR